MSEPVPSPLLYKATVPGFYIGVFDAGKYSRFTLLRLTTRELWKQDNVKYGRCGKSVWGLCSGQHMAYEDFVTEGPFDTEDEAFDALVVLSIVYSIGPFPGARYVGRDTQYVEVALHDWAKPYMSGALTRFKELPKRCSDDVQ